MQLSGLETTIRQARQKEGISNAKKIGKYTGRKTAIDEKLIAEVKRLKNNPKLSVLEISKLTGKSQSTIYKVFRQN